MICISISLILISIVFGFGSFLMNEERHKNKFKVYISGPMTGYLNIPCFETYLEFKKFLEDKIGNKN